MTNEKTGDTLFINACVRAGSRTMLLAEALLSRWDDPVTEVRLGDLTFPEVDEAFLDNRDRLIAEGAFDDPLFECARQFAAADRIVIAAPYWDLSFPAALKQYLEQVNVVGITFAYSPEGFPVGLCRAKQLIYISTAGGEFVPDEFGFGYVKSLAQNFYGIQDVRQIRAKGLDMDGADVEGIMKECLESIEREF